MLLFTLCNAAVSDRKSVRSMPRSMARREHAALMIPVPPMKRTLISAYPVYVTFHIMQRRSFLAVPLVSFQLAGARSDERVYAYGDGIPHTPEQYARLLGSLAANDKLEPDD